MKHKYLVLPLLLFISGCKGNTYDISYPSSFTSNKVNDSVYFNVFYLYVFEEHSYRVYPNEENEEYFVVPPKNVYELNVGSLWKNDTFIHNEYFVATNELFIYND